MPHWRVHHRLAKPIALANAVAKYPALGIELTAADGCLVGIVHVLAANDVHDRHAAILASKKLLALLLDVMEFSRGESIAIAESRPELIEAASQRTGAKLAGTSTVGVSASVVRPVRLPTEARLLAAPARLAVWLRLANDAARSDSPADAVRNYYMIWEDMYGRPDSAVPDAYRLKLVRDFVSHGEVLKNSDVLDLLEQELGTGVVQYDPTNHGHVKLVERTRRVGQKLIEVELMQLLGESI
jgi:hypothetical protein